MGFDISTHGDYLEHSYAEFIKSRMPLYEDIWKIYIGNNGAGKMIEIPNIKGEDHINRIKFSELNYSCLESIVALKRIADKNTEYVIIEKFDDYLNAQNEFILFQVFLGRIRDLVEKMGVILGINALSEPLYEYYQQRNTVIHGKKLPFIIIYGVLGLVEPQGKEEDNSKWSSDKNWQDVDTNDFKILSEFYNDSFNELLNILMGVYNTMLVKVKEIVKMHTIIIEPKQSQYDYSVNPFENLKLGSYILNISGSTSQ